MSSRILAVIPARGGSKRIPHKNIKDFLGRPLIAYSIDAARESGLFTDIIVSTDDPEIAETARKYGAQVPFMRSAELANDFTGTAPVAADALWQMQQAGHEYDAVCIIYATAPLLTSNHLKQAYAKFSKDNADYLFSCCEFPFPIQRGFYQDENGAPIAYMPECQPMRSQDLPKAYQDAGQFYFMSPSYLLTALPACDGEAQKPDHEFISRMYEMPRYRVIDIDTPEDWDYALILAEAVKKLNKE